MQEAKAAGQMLHSGIVTVYDLTEDKDGYPAMVMEFVEGTTLDKLMSGERLPFKRCMNLLAQAARALDYAHQRNVIHRDIKPANLLVTRSDILKIADFGVAKLAGSSLTLTGQLLGTPAFMSPEQFTGSAVDGRSDLFSLGSILYWMCTGELPFPGESVTSIGIKVMQAELVSVRQLNPSLPEDIDHVIARSLAKRPDDRYSTAAEFAADLEALGSGSPLPSKPKKT
jgi:serine/threonine-protein kinase